MYITPVSDMQALEAQVEQSASYIAALPETANGADSVDLSTEMVDLMQAGNNFAADVKAQEVMDENTQTTLSLIG